MSQKTQIKSNKNNISEKFIDQLYSMSVGFVDENGKKLEIPESGFLGLLATGYKGLAMLRKKRGQTHLYYKFTKGRKLIRKNPGAKKSIPVRKNHPE